MFRMISYTMISSNRYENILSHTIHRNHFLHINGIQTPKGGIIGTDTCTFIQRSGNFRRKNSFYTERWSRSMFQAGKQISPKPLPPFLHYGYDRLHIPTNGIYGNDFSLTPMLSAYNGRQDQAMPHSIRDNQPYGSFHS